MVEGGGRGVKFRGARGVDSVFAIFGGRECVRASLLKGQRVFEQEHAHVARRRCKIYKSYSCLT